MGKVISASKARANIYKIIDEASAEHEPILITGKRHNAVLVSQEDWDAIQETLYLSSIPGMRESIVEGMKIPIEECATEIEW